jgi:hypothetical protein
VFLQASPRAFRTIFWSSRLLMSSCDLPRANLSVPGAPLLTTTERPGTIRPDNEQFHQKVRLLTSPRPLRPPFWSCSFPLTPWDLPRTSLRLPRRSLGRPARTSENDALTWNFQMNIASSHWHPWSREQDMEQLLGTASSTQELRASRHTQPANEPQTSSHDEIKVSRSRLCFR